MSNPILGQILQSALRARTGGFGGAPGGMPGGSFPGGLGGGALGGILGGMLGRGGAAGRAGGSNQRTILLAMMLPLVMRWVQRNGGIGAVLDRFRQHGLGAQADSWVSTGQNHEISPQDVRRVVGNGELANLASGLGVPEDEVAQAFSQALPELTDQLTPEGRVTEHADRQLAQGADTLEEALGELHADMQHLP